MMFIDGTNLLCGLSRYTEARFAVDRPPTAALEAAFEILREGVPPYVQGWNIRRYWFASYSGNDEERSRLANKLRSHSYEPVLFKRRDGREKGVDIALTKEMLVNAFQRNYDVGFLVAGDEDYVTLVAEAKRYGPVVKGAFFKEGLADELRLALDDIYFLDGKGPEKEKIKQRILDGMKAERRVTPDGLV